MKCSQLIGKPYVNLMRMGPNRRYRYQDRVDAVARAKNKTKSRVRAKVEHVFAQQEAMGRMLVWTIGVVRARFRIGMMNLAYNLRRLAWLKASQGSAMA